MPTPEIPKESLRNQQNEFDLEKGLLGPNLRLKSQLTPEQQEKSFSDPSFRLATYYPHSTLGPKGIFATGEIYADCYRTFGLERINKISQLGEIAVLSNEMSETALAMTPAWRQKLSTATSTTRWMHSLTTAVILELMLRNNAFGEKDIRKGISAGLLHDAAIFPFSDLTVIESRFNEDHNLPLYFGQIDQKKRKEFEQKYAIACSELPRIAKGEGVLGSFLKIADRLAYTAYDSVNFSILLRERRKSLGKGDNPLEEMVDIFESKPNLFDIFAEVKVDSKKGAYFESAQNLALFLRVRALMNVYVYLNPERLKFQAAVRRLMYDLSAQGKVDVREFMKMTDLEFSARMYPLIQRGRKDAGGRIKFLRFESKEDVRKFIVGADGQPKSPEFFWIEQCPGFDTLIQALTRDPKDGEIKTFKQVCPKEAAEMEQLNRQTQGVVAYYFKKE